MFSEFDTSEDTEDDIDSVDFDDMAEGSSIQERISQLKQSQNTVTTRQVDVPQGISGAGEVNNNQANHQQPRHSNFDPTRSKSATSIQSNDSQNRN